jgi:chaperonin cofactor prefoldin
MKVNVTHTQFYCPEATPGDTSVPDYVMNDDTDWEGGMVITNGGLQVNNGIIALGGMGSVYAQNRLVAGETKYTVDMEEMRLFVNGEAKITVDLLVGTVSIIELEERVSVLEDRVDGHDEDIADLQARADDLEARADDLEYRADDLEARADDLEARADDLEARADDLEYRADDSDSRIDGLEAEIASLQAQIAAQASEP